jgi:hypothetical protein
VLFVDWDALSHVEAIAVNVTRGTWLPTDLALLHKVATMHVREVFSPFLHSTMGPASSFATSSSASSITSPHSACSFVTQSYASSFATPNSDIQDANFDQIFELLHTVYWQGLEREVGEVILAYQELEKYQPDPTPNEQEEPDLTGHNFEAFCNLLSKLRICTL